MSIDRSSLNIPLPELAPRMPALLRLLRPHQWTKNALIFLPVLAAHRRWTAETVLLATAGFVAFSALASAVYVVNDMLDVENDRLHATKRRRPIAAGEVSVRLAWGTVGLLLAVAIGASLTCPPAFTVVLVAYALLTSLYSFWLKGKLLVDVVVLATLYVARVVAGKFLFDVPLSRLFIVFTLFFFFGLALAKRVAELWGREIDSEESVPGRAYRRGDLQVLVALGAAAASVTALVYSAYVMSEDVRLLYSWPDALWPVLPLLIYWQGRLWLFANRGALHEDPVVFALRDRVSHLVLLATFVCLAVATFGRSSFGD